MSAISSLVNREALVQESLEQPWQNPVLSERLVSRQERAMLLLKTT